MTLRNSRIAAIAVGVCALVAVPALAAPDQTAVLSAATPKFEWDGAVSVSAGVPNGVRESIPCKTPGARPCEDVLLEVKDAGKLTVKVDGGPGGPPEDDVDVTLYESDKSGAAGKQLAQGIAAGPDQVSAKVVPGYYLAQVEYYRAKGSAYHGVATLAATPAAVTPVVVPVTPPAVSAPAPAANSKPAPAGKKNAAKKCKKAAKKIKNASKRKKALKRCAKSAKPKP